MVFDIIKVLVITSAFSSSNIWLKFSKSDLVKDILDQAAKINQEIVHPLAKIGDDNPCVYENGIVRSPPGYKEAYKKK